MSRKSPPPRPPAPKMSTGGSLSYSFKALEEEDDDEELTVFTGKFDKKVHDEKERQSQEYERQRSASKSPTGVSVCESDNQQPSNTKSQKSLDMLKDPTGKFQDKITKKNEDLASESSVKGPMDEDLSEENTKEFSLNNWHDKIKEEKGVSLNDLEREDEFVDCKNEDGSVQSDINSLDMEDNLEISEDYYDKDSKDFSDLPITETAVRQRKGFNRSGKIKPVKPSAPVKMSGLNQKMFDGSHVKTATPSGYMQTNTNYSNKGKDDKANLDKNGAKIPITKLAASIIFIIIYMVFPLPSYISGMIAGIILSSGGWLLYLWVIEPSKPRKPIPDDLPLDKLPPMPTPAMKEPKGEDHGISKGWMNEVIDYVPETYSINHTHSVFVLLEGTTLRLRRPKINVPKRAMWDEPTISPQFIHQRHFDVQGSKILLLPPGLVKKRLWSKKYPICIALANVGHKPTGKQDTASETTTESPSVATGMSISHSDESVQGFEMVQEQKCDTGILYLFARTCHEKETWFRKLNAASKGTPWKNHILEIHRILNSSNRQRRSSSSDSLKHKRQESIESLSSVGSNSPCTEDVPLNDIDLKEFVMYMSRLLPKDKDKDRDSLQSSPAHPGMQKDKPEPKPGGDLKSISGNGSKAVICDPVLLPINALLGRCFWDFLRDTYWSNKVKEKLQKKLSKIHIPYFIEELKISEIDLGTEVPVIRRANKPYLDENGFWIDLDLTYSGKFKMTIETKVNLLKLKEKSSKVQKEKSKEDQRSAVTDSEEEDSAESSSDEEDETSTVGEDGTAQSAGTGKKILKYINKITASKYFQSATENKYIKKAMTGVSNTRLILTVELQKLNGTLAINIPVPPSDRLWYGFRGNPQLWLVAKPKVGEREVTMSHITEWIEKKLTMEFQHVLVMPNMDDFVIPILLPDVSVSEACSESHPHLGSEV